MNQRVDSISELEEEINKRKRLIGETISSEKARELVENGINVEEDDIGQENVETDNRDVEQDNKEDDNRDDEQFFIKEDIEDSEEAVQKEEGQLKFKSIRAKERAKKNKRISDIYNVKYLNIALMYFKNRCALSGEQFVLYDENYNSRNWTNLSAEHVIALSAGGDNIAPNLVPSVGLYNFQKQSYYILDWWKKAKDINGKCIYSPYRLLRLINYMMKSIEARGRELEEYEHFILTPNAIDIFLEKIESQDRIEEKNEDRNLLSSTITALDVDRDGKKILTEMPLEEGSIISQYRQSQKEYKFDSYRMMDIFLEDAIECLAKDGEFANVLIDKSDGTKIGIIEELKEMFKRIEQKIPVEIFAKKRLIEILKNFNLAHKDAWINLFWDKDGTLQQMLENKQQKLNLQEVRQVIEKNVDEYKEVMKACGIGFEDFGDAILYKYIFVRLDFWLKNRKSEISQLIKEYKSVDKLVDVLILLKKRGISLLEINFEKTIIDLIQNFSDKEKILTLIIQLTGGTGFKIKNAMINQHYKDNFASLKERLYLVSDDNGNKFFDEQEIETFIRNNTPQKVSKRNFMKDLYILRTVLIVLKKHGVNMFEITFENSTNDVIKSLSEELQEKIKTEITQITGKDNYEIGKKLQVYKNSNPVLFRDRLVNAKDEHGTNIFEGPEITFLTMRKSKKWSEIDVTIKVLEVLKKYNVNMISVYSAKTINDITKSLNKPEQEKIRNEIAEITGEMNFKLIRKMDSLSDKNIFLLMEKLEQASNEDGSPIFNKEEIFFLLNKGKIHNYTMEKLVEVLVLLKDYGIDVTKIKDEDSINDLLKGLEEEEKRRIHDLINNKIKAYNFNIGSALSRNRENYRASNNFRKYLNMIKNKDGKLVFTGHEIFVLTHKEVKKQITGQEVGQVAVAGQEKGKSAVEFTLECVAADKVLSIAINRMDEKMQDEGEAVNHSENVKKGEDSYGEHD